MKKILLIACILLFSVSLYASKYRLYIPGLNKVYVFDSFDIKDDTIYFTYNGKQVVVNGNWLLEEV